MLEEIKLTNLFTVELPLNINPKR